MLRSAVREIINYRPPTASPASNASVPPPAGDYIISTVVPSTRIQIEKYFATSLIADHSKVRRGAVWPRPSPPPLSYATCDVSHVPATPMSVICPAITWHGTQCTPLPHARSSCCCIKLRRPTRRVSEWHKAADCRDTGRSVLQSRGA